MAQRPLTAKEQVFFLERALVAQARANLIEQVQEFIRQEHPVTAEGDAMEVQEFIEEVLVGTGYYLDGQIDYATEGDEPA